MWHSVGISGQRHLGTLPLQYEWGAKGGGDENRNGRPSTLQIPPPVLGTLSEDSWAPDGPRRETMMASHAACCWFGRAAAGHAAGRVASGFGHLEAHFQIVKSLSHHYTGANDTRLLQGKEKKDMDEWMACGLMASQSM